MNYSWHRRSMDSIFNGALTNSKRAECFVKGVYPTHIKHGLGAHLIDADNKKYIDFICALGTNLLGYANQQLNDAIIRQLYKGTVFSLGSTLEVTAAEAVKEIVPFVSKLRFLKTGSDACNAAVRIALAHTGREKVLSHGYHGIYDQFVSLTPPALGIPKQTHIETLTSFDQITKEVACVIIEPVITDYSSERLKYLNDLKEVCKKNGTLLIFDEVITGFRWKNWTFSNDSGIHPDIITLGKCIGGGLPLSVVACKAGIGEDKEWFVSSSFAGDTTAMAGLLETIKLLRNKYDINHLWDKGNEFIKKFNEIAPNIVKIDGYPTRGVFVADQLNKALFFQESCKAGILFGPSFFFNFTHIEYMDSVLNSCRDILTRIKHKQIELEGELPVSPFAQKMRE